MVRPEPGQVLLNMVPGIRLCVIGGIRGSGVHTLGTNLYDQFARMNIPAIQIDADTFTETRVEYCETCYEYAMQHGHNVDNWIYECNHHPG